MPIREIKTELERSQLGAELGAELERSQLVVTTFLRAKAL